MFKIAKFRSLQLETMNATLSGKHCILIMPTGGGKSLCFQLPALVNKGNRFTALLRTWTDTQCECCQQIFAAALLRFIGSHNKQVVDLNVGFVLIVMICKHLLIVIVLKTVDCCTTPHLHSLVNMIGYIPDCDNLPIVPYPWDVHCYEFPLVPYIPNILRDTPSIFSC